MPDEKSTTIRVHESAHDILRYNSFLQSRSIVEIIDDLVKELPKPSISEKVGRMLANK